MDTNRANITFLVNELLEENLIREGARGSEKVRGRKPTFLYVNSKKSFAIAVDIRSSRTFLMLTDSIGNQIDDIQSFATETIPEKFVSALAANIVF